MTYNQQPMDNSEPKIEEKVAMPKVDLPMQDPRGTKFRFETRDSVFEINRATAMLKIELKEEQSEEVESDFVGLVRETIAGSSFIEYFIPALQVSVGDELRSVRVCVCEVVINGYTQYCLFTLLETFGGKTANKSIFSKVNHDQILFSRMSGTMANVIQSLLAKYHVYRNPVAATIDDTEFTDSDYIIVNESEVLASDFDNFQTLFKEITSVVGRHLLLLDRDSDDPTRIIIRINVPFTMF